MSRGIESTSGCSFGASSAPLPAPVSVRLAGAVLVFWMAAGFTGCRDEDAPASAPIAEATSGTTADDPPLSISIERSRLFGAARQFYLTFRSTSGAEVEVTSAQLRSELFSSVEPSERSIRVSSSGDPISIPLAYGAATCRGTPSPELFVRIAIDGEPADVALGKAAPDILREHDSECAGDEVRRQVGLGFGSDWQTVDGGSVAGTLIVDPRPGAEVVLEGVSTSVVFTVEVLSPLPATDDIDVVVAAARCDPHALTESKKTFTFFLTFTNDGGDPVLIELPVEDGPAHEALEGAIEVCVAEGGDG